MSRLQVYLLLNTLPPLQPWYVPLLEQLRGLTRLRLTVINNGQPYEPRRLFHQLGLTCQLITYPLRFHPAQILLELLEQPPKEPDPILWLEDQLVWHPRPLSQWLEALKDWSWISPHFLPGQGQSPALRLYQEQARVSLERPAQIQHANDSHFPACLLFLPSAAPQLKAWIRQSGQLSLLQMAGCDVSSPAWHPNLATAPEQLNLDLSIPEALARWEQIGGEELSPARQQVLLQSLQRAAPDALAIYSQWLPLLPVAEALEQLITVFQRGLIYPETLTLLGQALAATGQKQLAEACFEQVKARFPAHQLLGSPWPAVAAAGQPVQSGQQSFPLQFVPRQARLSVCLVVKDQLEALPVCLESLQGLKAEIIVVDTGSTDGSPARAQALGARVLSHTWQQDFAAARNQALQAATGDWILILNADEFLKPEAVHFLNQFLWFPPPGLPRFCLQMIDSSPQGEVLAVRNRLRLFPRHTLFAYTGRIHEQLVYQGPGSPKASNLPGLQVHRILQDSDAGLAKKAQGQLAILMPLLAEQPAEPKWQFYSGHCYAQLQAPEQALSHYAQALQLWAEGPAPELRHLYQRCLLGQLQAYLSLGQQDAALQAALAAEKDCREHPDYWYLRGEVHLQQAQWPEAVKAFEHCLAFRGQEASLHLDFHPGHLETLPLLKLTQLYRRLLHEPQQSLRQQLQLANTLLQILPRLCQLYPEGYWAEDQTNLYTLLAEAALASARLQPGLSALQLYRQALPGSDNSLVAYQTETALIFLAGQPEQLLDRLPPEYSFESLREMLQQDELLQHFCEHMWQRPELDGEGLVTQLLSLLAIGRQAPSWSMLLARLFHTAERTSAAVQVLAAARLHFPEHRYLHYDYCRFLAADQQREQALQELKQLQQMAPDFAPARELWLALQAASTDF